MEKKDYAKECGWENCDGGVGCKDDNPPPISICEKCLCYKCIKGKCQDN